MGYALYKVFIVVFANILGHYRTDSRTGSFVGEGGPERLL